MATSMGKQFCWCQNILTLIKTNRTYRIHNNITKSCTKRDGLRLVSCKASLRSSKKPDLTTKEEEDNEDFFGIPENFKLQHARTGANQNSSRSLPTEVKGGPDSIQGSKTCYDHPKLGSMSENADKKTESRRMRRVKKGQPTSFPTSFGLISFDRSATGRSEDLASKAQEIMKLRSSYSSDTTGSMQKVDQRTKTISDYPPQASAEDVAAMRKDISPNIFDDQYFGTLHEEQDEFKQKSASHLNYFDEQFFGNLKNLEKGRSNEDDHKIESDPNFINDSNSKTTNSKNFFDEQYFGDLPVRSHLQSHELKKEKNRHTGEPTPSLPNSVPMTDELSDIDRQFFMGDAYQTATGTQNSAPSLQDVAKRHFDFQSFDRQMRTSLERESTDEISTKQKTVSGSTNFVSDDSVNQRSGSAMQDFHKGILSNKDILKKQENIRKSYSLKLSSENSEPNSALHYAMKVRESLKAGEESHKTEQPGFKVPSEFDTTANDEAEEDLVPSGRGYRFDSKGYRILDVQVPNFDTMTSADAVRMLKSRIIFNHDDFLAIDKPYGLASFGQKQDRLSVSTLLPDLVAILPRKFQAEHLYVVQGLDRDVTGALVLAKSPETAQILKRMYNDSDSSIQRYWAVTKGVPKLSEGTIDIPIGEGRVDGSYKRMLRPLYRHTGRPGVKLSKAPSERAVTDYKLLSRNRTSALLECTPQTNGVKHQLRVHLAHGLNTPILGDHKYSHFARLAPQKLDPNTLTLLKIRQAKVRHLALHLHLRSLIFSNYKGRMIFLTTRPPNHFSDNLRSLKLHIPKK